MRFIEVRTEYTGKIHAVPKLQSVHLFVPTATLWQEPTDCCSHSHNCQSSSFKINKF
jgi:hypothetical protein